MDRLARRNMLVEDPNIVPPRGNELTMAELFLTLRRRRNLIGITIVVCILLGVLACVLTTPRYEGKGVLEIPKTSADMLDVQSMMAGATADGSGDALNANLDLQTESEILQASFKNRRINRLEKEDAEGYTKEILFQYNDRA